MGVDSRAIASTICPLETTGLQGLAKYCINHVTVDIPALNFSYAIALGLTLYKVGGLISMTKKFLIILALVILLIPIIGCQNQHSNQKEAVTGNKFVPPPFTKITVYVDGNKIDLKKDDSKFKTLSDEIYKGIVNITDGVGGQRTFREVGFEKEKEPDYLKKTFIYLLNGIKGTRLV
ncbi:hypothetical protein Dtox_1840 [Desulfofarcimen acetoxidans DSM 771]|uniref:Uncharacterized protein n=1 Tax=Desulfofarcimen acetoxidans (strain ATCC 49208 / DSM 771 / KCTC 5769 / VKM B-1644 / 5575) TaxID=485916 RepID=C8VXN2_DESAS|nr:hypothetical protein [Desulfofarcimen acetoxidans]ACV62688.1 hypothetical protein Dtox_1840 [Desulfofarcimen acetoxidans DSM 771]